MKMRVIGNSAPKNDALESISLQATLFYGFLSDKDCIKLLIKFKKNQMQVKESTRKVL